MAKKRKKQYVFLNFILKVIIKFTYIPYFDLVISLFLATIAYMFRIRYSVLQKNLAIAFGNSLYQKEKRILILRIYYKTIFNFFQLFYFLRISKTTLKSRIQVEASPKVLEIAQTEQPMILLTTHFRSTVIPVLFSSVLRDTVVYTYYNAEHPCTPVYDVFNRLKEKFGFEIIFKNKKETIQMISRLKKGKCLEIIGDLNDPQSNFFINFFGKKAAFGQGAFRLALRLKIPIIMGWYQTDKNHFTLHLKEIYCPNQDQQKLSMEDLIQRYASNLESLIMQSPHNYLWFNKRWKTRPKGDLEKVYT